MCGKNPIICLFLSHFSFENARIKVDNKKSNMVARGYIMEGVIIKLTSFLSVPKGTYDICMVFNDTVSGLSNSLWATKIMLPSMGSFIIMVGPKTHMVNLAVGVTFYSFKISLVLTKYCGVDLGYYLEPKKDNQGTSLWRLWVRQMMGLVLSPYSDIHGL